jgi:GH25 family lysozyme M1 (1,4-beta-N-acetylmuramidase)
MTTPYLPQTMSDVVIDLSHWEAPVDFAQVKAAG